jgi:hypothetical protein
MVKGKKGEQDSLVNRLDIVAPSHVKLLRSKKKTTSGVEGEGSKFSWHGKGKTQKVSVEGLLDNPKFLKDVPWMMYPIYWKSVRT